MGISEICSPVTRPGSKVGSGQPKSPGAFSNASRSGDGVQAQPSHARVSLSSGQEPASLTIVGPSPEE
jgi:hypothetical protein